MTPIVFTMGKVGSTAMSEAIKSAGSVCFDIHSLDEDAIGCSSRWHKQAFALNDAAKHGGLWITAVRDPVARNLSAFFENFSIFMPERDYSPEEALNRFLETYPHHIPITWMDNEVKRFLNIDVYASAFDTGLGFKFYDERLLLLRADMDDAAKSDLLSLAIGRGVRIERHNSGSQKATGELYAQVKDLARGQMPVSYLDKMYDTKYAQHFWSPEQLQKLRDEWL